jgi:probable F420-dependent oxidoreductase
MHRHRPFRFGVLAFGAESGQEFVALARRSEALGYATFAMADHLSSKLAPIAAMATAAATTTTLRVGCGVFANDLRNPVVFAQEMASLDVLSDGRLELGLGTGYAREDYEWTGIPLDPPGVRVARLAEAVQVVKAFFGPGPVDFVGRYYTVRGLQPIPQPVQRPHPPILIGGGGRRMLELAVREADIVGINVRTTPAGAFDWASVTPDATDEKVTWVRDAAGARWAELELHTLVPCVAITDDPWRAAQGFIDRWDTVPGREMGSALSVDELLTSPMALIGSEDHIVETLLARRERFGITYLSVFPSAIEAFAPVVARLAGL